MGVMDRYNERKKKKDEENTGGKSASGGVADRYEKNQYYQTLDTDSVNDEYINTFISDSNRFFDGLNNGSVSYSGAVGSIGDLDTRVDTIQGWLYKNRGNLDEESYKSLSSTFDEIKSSIGEARKYYSQWDSEDSYNSWAEKESFIKDYIADPDKALQGAYDEEWLKEAQYRKGYEGYIGNINAADYADKSQYVSTANGKEKFNAWTGMYTDSGFDDLYYDYINGNEDARGVVSVNGVADNSALLGLDKSFLQTMTDEEIGVFNYLYATQGSEKAWEFIDYIGSDLTARQRMKEQQQWADYAKESPVKSSIFSVLMAPAKGLSYIGQAADYMADGTIDQNAGYNKFSYIPSSIRGQVSSTIENSGKWGAVGSFAYNTGMSMGDFLFTTAVSGGNQALSLAIMGTGAAADATISAKDRGLSDNQAFTLGTIAGIAEVAMEKISLGAWLEGDMSEGALKYVLKNALSEGGEEVGTSVINLLADVLIAGDKNEWKTAMDAYMAEGKSEAEAFGLVAADQAMQIGLDFLGGALSGSIISGATYGVSSTMQNVEAQKIYGSNPGGLVSEALDIDPNNRYAQKMQGRLDSGKKLSGGQINKLIQQNETAMTAQDMASIQSAAAQRLTELGETGNVDTIAAALAKQAAGEKLGVAERRAIKDSRYGQRVANELNTNNIQSGEYSSQWAEKLDTNRINAEEYSRLVQQAQTEQTAQDAQETAKTAPQQDSTIQQKPAQAESVEAVANSDATVQENQTVDAQQETTPAVATTEKSSETGKESLQVESAQEESTVSIEDVSKKYGAQAVAMVHTYQAGQDVEKYDSAYGRAYEMGYSGVSMDYMKKSPSTAYLTDTQKELAWEAGKAASDTEAADKAAANAKLANGKTGWKKGVVKGDGVTVTDLNNSLNKTQGKAYKILSTIAEATGIDIVLYQSNTNDAGKFQGAQGQYKPSEPGTLYIDLNAGILNEKNADELAKYTMLRTFSHEFTHFIENWNPVQYNEFRRVVFDTLDQRGENVEKLISGKQKGGMSYDAASREVVAEAMTDILPDSNFVQELAQKHKTILDKLIDKLKEFVANIKEYFASIAPNNSREANALKETVDGTARYLESIVKLYDKMAVQTVENFQMTVATEETVQEDNSNGRREETREAFLGRAGKELYEVNERGQAVYAFRRHISGNLSESAGIVERILREKGIPVIVCDLFEVNRDGITTPRTEAVAVAGDAVYVLNSITTDPIESANHEAFHFWKHDEARIAYAEVVTENIDYASKATIDFLGKIEQSYIGEAVEVDGDHSNKVLEEALAYLTGFTQSGDPQNIAHEVLRDYDAVKAAWEELVNKQTGKTTPAKATHDRADSEKMETPEPAVEAPTQKDAYTDLGEQLKKYTHVDIDGIRYSANEKKEGGYYGNIKHLPVKAGGVPIENAKGTIYSSYTPGFATREEAIADLVAVARNNKLLGEIQAAETKEVVSNGQESGNGTDEGAVREPVLRGETAPQLLDGVEPGTVQRGSEGREPVQSGEQQGPADAGRDGRADAAGTAPERGTRNRVAGDLQQQPDSGAGGDKSGTGLSGAVQEERSDHDGRGTGRLDGEPAGLTPEALHEEVQEEIAQKSTTKTKGGNFVIGDSLDLPSGTKARTRANIDAIRLVKQLQAEGRTATAEEQVILSKYVGWGGLADAFGKPFNNRETRKIEYQPASGLETEFAELKEVLTDEEYKAARESTKNAHYTSIEVIKAMYDGLAHLGFTGGRMLEPSSGVGNFVGAMPASMSATVKSWTMVELDNITGQIAKYLYPHADVRIQGFEETNIPDGYMDVAIGNVPFGNYAITDKHYPATVTKAIHNYFFAKALDKVRPGGIVMFITSAYTMNGSDSSVRKYIMQRADLLGAIRLPNTAFAGNAGTQVVTDILVLKKRADRTEYKGEAFEVSTKQDMGQGWNNPYVNEYFQNHPEMVLGIPKLTRGMYSSNELTYDPFTGRGSLGDQIRKAMDTIEGRMDYTAQVSPEKANFEQQRAKKKARKLKVENGTIQAVDENGNLEKVQVDQDTANRITGMISIRESYTALTDALQQGVTAKEANKLRKQLNQVYDAFVDKYGILNAPKNKKAINAFADRYSILSLENYDAEKKTATKTDIFTKNTISANRTAASAENVEEGLTISLNTVGAVDTSMIARLTGQKVEDVTRQLIDQRLVFKDKDGVLIPAVQYLSGNVRAKLREMEGLVGIDKDYRNNVEALRAIVPETIPYTDIYVNPGATWVPVSVYEDFVGYILKRSNYASYRTGKKDFQVEYVPETNEYKVSINDSYAKSSAQNTQVWGEGGKRFETIFENMLNGRRTNVYMDGPDGKRVLDRAKTEAVAEKVEKLNEEFRKWLWSDESRRAEMQELYNESYNALVNPKYSGDGLTVNGMNSALSLRPHQADAVARIINSGGNTLLAHRVGAGKTMEMAAAAMKLKQLGVIKKPMFVVPNNVVAQWGKEFIDYFPAANILVVGDDDMTAAERMTTINRIKNNDYDAVIIAYTKFEKIQMTSAWRKHFYEEQIDNIMFAINAEKEASKGKGFTVKQLENKRKQLENRIKKLTEKSKDEDGAMFEDLGVDALFVDEAHNFKNLEYTTRMNNVSGLGKADGSQRAFDLYTKVRYLQQLNGGRGIVFATATPVMNSMTEMYIMQRYLQPDTMKQLGIDNFDSWAKMFGEVVNALEISPSGSGYRLKQTFSKFKNVKALQQLFRSFTDVLTDVPGLKIPKMKGGKVQIVECAQSEFQENYMAELAKRAENVKNVDPSEDNMLKITSDGRKISYSQRMIDPTLPYEEGGKIYKCCENVFRVWQESKKVQGTQMIFCDMATPKGKDKSKADTDTSTDEFGSVDAESAQLYDDMKARLVQLGIPAKEIAFIHDAKNDKQKAALAEKMNNGTIRVLIGSTGKMGVGLNAQMKAVAIHHLDAPWRPGDIEQRDGRVFRQKNQNEEAYKFVYVTKGSFDSRLWDILERKQKFINQIMNGEDVGNEVEDTGEVTLSAAEVKAVASGSPLIMEQVALEKEISKLESLQQAHNAGVNRAKEKIIADERRIAELNDRIAKVQEDIKNSKDTYSSEKKFSIQIGSQTFTDKKDAGVALVTAAQAKAVEGSFTAIGKFAGFTLRVVKTNEGINGVIAGAQNYDFKTYPLNPTYGINHLVSIMEGLEGRLQGWQTALHEVSNDLKTQKELAAGTFAQAEKLKEKRARYREVMDILNPPVEQTVAEDVQEQSRDYLEDEQHQERSESLTDRDILEMAAENAQLQAADMTEGERFALDTFQKRLGNLRGLQQQRKELGRLYKEQQFGPNVDRKAAEQTHERMKILDEKIQVASNEVLDVQEKPVLRRILQNARTVVEQAQREHDEQKFQRWRDRRDNAAAIKKYRERLRTDTNDLTNWVLHPNNKDVVKHIPDVLKNSVIPFLSSIDFTSKQQLRGGAATKADQEFMKRLNGLKAALKPNTSAEGLYADYSDLPPNFMDRLQMLIDSAQAIVEKHSGEFVVNQMTSNELRELSQVVRTLKEFIKNFNKFHANAMFQHVHEAGDSTISELALMGNASDKTGAVSNFIFWKQMRPAYAFERFGEGGKAIYDELRRGQAKLAFNTKEIQAFAEKAYTEAEVKAWEKEIKSINLGGDIVKMPVSTIMSFYELSKRPQALGHILGQGIRVATYKADGKKISDVGHAVEPGDVSTIIGTLTDRQKEVADSLQKYMQEQGGKWGNYVSVKRFGEELFGEEHYFPINSDGRHLAANADEHPEVASLYALLNMGFTKSTTEGANNRIVLYSIFDVFANHMASMAQYNAFALPVVDAIKWFNYQQKSEPDENGKRMVLGSVRDQMDRVYGVPEETRPGSGKQGYAQNFVINILKAFNGTEAQGAPNDSFGLQALHKYNRAQVAYNLRVVVQQPLAITRAAMLVDYRSIIKGMKLSPAAIQKNIQEMQKYSGIAAWKSLGFYDVNISRGLTSIIKHDTSLMDKVTDVGMKGAEAADTLTWAAMWSACKEEVIRKQHLTPKSDGFYEAVTNLFEDVVYKTQVVDSVLTKNEYLRSKGFFARATASFMSEPTTTASMLIDAYDKYHADIQRGMNRTQAWKKNGKMIVRTAYVYGLGAVLLAAVQAVADAFRDDDDYRDFLGKWLEAFGGNLVDELMPLNKLPLVSDFYEVAKELISQWTDLDVYGNPHQSVFMQWYDSLVKGSEIIHDKITGEDTNYTLYGGAYKLLQAASGMTGLPMAAATREIVTAWNNIVGSMAPSLKVKTYESGEKNEIKYAYQDGYLTAEEATEQLLQHGLVDNEDEAYWTIQGWEAGEGYSRYEAIFDAVRNGGDFNAAMDELLNHGYTEEEVLSKVKSQVGTWYQDQEITKQQAINMLKKYSGLGSEEITEAVNKWSCKVVTGIAYDDIKSEYMTGNITASRAIEMYVRYGGMTQEEAEQKVATMAFVKAHPETDGISYAAVAKYQTYCEENGVEAETFYDVWKYYNRAETDRDENGKIIYSSKDKTMDYIDTLDLTSEQKDSLYYAMGWKKGDLWKAPWH